MKKIYILLILSVLGMILSLFKIERNVHVERSIIINAPIDEIKAQIIDLKKFQKWSPWTQFNSQNDINSGFNDLQNKVGAQHQWSGNTLLGTGSLTITEINKSKIEMQMEFLAPQESTSSIYFMFQKTKKGTKVTWGYDESHPIMVSFMINLDHQ